MVQLQLVMHCDSVFGELFDGMLGLAVEES